MATSSLAINVAVNQVTQPPGFQELYNRYSETVYRAALRVTGNTADAEDVLQTVFMRLLHRESVFGIEVKPEAYFRRAATNASIDIIRRKNTRSETEIDEQRDRAAAPAQVLLKVRLRQALATLETEDAELFVLHYLEGLSHEELAKQFNIRRGTVASRLFRIRQALQKEIER